jgi:hypothetical protein
MNEETTSVQESKPTPVGRLWSLRKVAAVAITAVALSGAGGAALAAASNGGSEGGGPGRGGFGGPPGRTGGQFPGHGQPPGVNGVPGQLPPATTDGGRET